MICMPFIWFGCGGTTRNLETFIFFFNTNCLSLPPVTSYTAHLLSVVIMILYSNITSVWNLTFQTRKVGTEYWAAANRLQPWLFLMVSQDDVWRLLVCPEKFVFLLFFLKNCYVAIYHACIRFNFLKSDYVVGWSLAMHEEPQVLLMEHNEMRQYLNFVAGLKFLMRQGGLHSKKTFTQTFRSTCVSDINIKLCSSSWFSTCKTVVLVFVLSERLVTHYVPFAVLVHPRSG